MEKAVDFWSVSHEAFRVWGVGVSYIELLGTAMGLSSVVLAVRVNIHTWTTGVANACVFFWLYFQVQLYADMLLQVFFFTSSLYGWWRWWRHGVETAEGPVRWLSNRQRVQYSVLLLLGTVGLGAVVERLHVWCPQLFTQAAAYAYADAFTTVLSMAAMVGMAAKRVESWWGWIVVDVVCVVLYVQKGIELVAVQYVVFLLLSVAGLLRWQGLARN